MTQESFGFNLKSLASSWGINTRNLNEFNLFQNFDQGFKLYQRNCSNSLLTSLFPLSIWTVIVSSLWETHLALVSCNISVPVHENWYYWYHWDTKRKMLLNVYHFCQKHVCHWFKWICYIELVADLLIPTSYSAKSIIYMLLCRNAE